MREWEAPGKNDCGPSFFSGGGVGEEGQTKACEAKPAYPVCLVYLVSLVDRNQKNLGSKIDQKE